MGNQRIVSRDFRGPRFCMLVIHTQSLLYIQTRSIIVRSSCVFILRTSASRNIFHERTSSKSYCKNTRSLTTKYQKLICKNENKIQKFFVPFWLLTKDNQTNIRQLSVVLCRTAFGQNIKQWNSNELSIIRQSLRVSVGRANYKRMNPKASSKSNRLVVHKCRHLVR